MEAPSRAIYKKLCSANTSHRFSRSLSLFLFFFLFHAQFMRNLQEFRPKICSFLCPFYALFGLIMQQTLCNISWGNLMEYIFMRYTEENRASYKFYYPLLFSEGKQTNSRWIFQFFFWILLKKNLNWLLSVEWESPTQTQSSNKSFLEPLF